MPLVVDARCGFDALLEPCIAPSPQRLYSVPRVVALGNTYITFAEDNTEEFKILFDPFRPDTRKVRDFPGEIYPILRDCIADAMKSGELRGNDPDLAAFYLWSRVHGIVTLLMSCDFSDELRHLRIDLTPSKLFEATREFVAFGLLSTKPTSKTRRKSARTKSRKR